MPPTAIAPAPRAETELQEWELDISFLESGEDVDKLIYMTDDGCGQTCQSACVSCR